jgi:uncharacterized membrane protein YagU involved in acid resistance
MKDRAKSDEVLAGLIVAGLGACAGVIAAAATSRFQAAWGRAHLPPTAQGDAGPPPTETLAKKICVAATGHSLAHGEVGPAGALVHYLMGAALGAAYGLLSRYAPEATAGRGALYGLGVWATVEECGLALLGLKPPPWDVEPAEHAFAASSHVVFGLSLDTALSALAPKDTRK